MKKSVKRRLSAMLTVFVLLLGCLPFVLFTLVFVLLFVLLTFVMGLEDMKSEMLLSIAVYAMLVATMLLYDRVYERMALIYERRLRDRLIRKPGSR